MTSAAVAENKTNNQKNASYDKKIIGKNIRVAMAITGINQKQLADLLSITQAAVSKWVTGAQSPDIFQLKKMSEIFKKPMEWFFKEIE
jgi:transcriptional regulator with XRE-family HTH domain